MQETGLPTKPSTLSGTRATHYPNLPKSLFFPFARMCASLPHPRRATKHRGAAAVPSSHRLVGASPTPKNLFVFLFCPLYGKTKKISLNLPTMLRTTKPIATAHYVSRCGVYA